MLTSNARSLDGIATLLIAGGRDIILPSTKETARLEELLRARPSGGSVVRKVLPEASDDDTVYELATETPHH